MGALSNQLTTKGNCCNQAISHPIRPAQNDQRIPRLS